MKRNAIRYATRGHVTGTGASVAAAKQDLDSKLDWLAQAHAPHVESRFGWMIIIMPTSEGWSTMLCHPATIGHGETKMPSTFEGTNPRETVIQRARYHVAQCAWAQYMNDAEHVASAGLCSSLAEDLGRWIRFQRRYTEAKAQGHDDSKAFDIAQGREAA